MTSPLLEFRLSASQSSSRVIALERTADLGFARACRRGCFGELKIHLLLERIHFCDLDLDAVAELEDLARSAANELAAGHVELVEIIAQA